MKSLAIFGATGSIGSSTLDLVRKEPDSYRVSILTAHSNVSAMQRLAQEFKPDLLVMSDCSAANQLERLMPTVPILSGADGLRSAAKEPYDLMIAGIVGFAGLAPTYQAISLGRSVALANKEALVCAGDLILSKAEETGALLLPVDSEHNAIFQCWEHHNREQIKSVQLTASGGPFRGWTAEQLTAASIDEALRHPNWNMGPKVTLDSATLMNKGLEMIEARWLFDLRPEQLEVVVHPQSIVHSCVTYSDGSTIAQMGQPDMRTPISYCLAYPNRAQVGGDILSLSTLTDLTFEKPDETVFPALKLARKVMAADDSSQSLALNAVNEVLSEAVLARQIAFGKLIPILSRIMDTIELNRADSIEARYALDSEIRAKSRELLDKWAR
ncbi:MAG: 1-deoxy-D-xylulose-5-phosphate reductoisomerase [Alphaproteobacteria bacterium]